jgi:SsrA-binding protein
MQKEKAEKKQVVTNKKAWHEYTIEETFEAGIALVGTEVKAIRAGRVALQDAYVKIEKGEAWVYNMSISPYEFGNRWNVEDTRRPRKLLLHRKEIERLLVRVQQKGLTIIPLKLYFDRGFAKLQIGVGRGKKLYDKREAIANRDIEMQRRRAEAGKE